MSGYGDLDGFGGGGLVYPIISTSTNFLCANQLTCRACIVVYTMCHGRMAQTRMMTTMMIFPVSKKTMLLHRFIAIFLNPWTVVRCGQHF
jgi:hypothetical protein